MTNDMKTMVNDMMTSPFINYKTTNFAIKSIE